MSFKPVVYLKAKCPFCMKIRIFLAESGMWKDVEVRNFAPGDANEQAIRDELAPHLEKVSFPAAQLEPGEYMTDSDAIVDRLAAKAGQDPKAMPVLQDYREGPFQQIMTLYKENMELKKQLA